MVLNIFLDSLNRISQGYGRGTKIDNFEKWLYGNDAAKGKLDGKDTLKALCKWTSIAKAAFPVTVIVPEYLHTNGDGKSVIHLSALLRFDFILPLVICSHILHTVVPIVAMLQGISFDLIEAVGECQTLIRLVENERNDISVYNT